MIKVYFESGIHAECVATFEQESVYMACLPALQEEANKIGCFVTESTEECTQVHKKHELVFTYDDSLIVLNITPTESDYWITTRASHGNKMLYFDVHYCEDYNEICVYLHDDKVETINYLNSIHRQAIKN